MSKINDLIKEVCPKGVEKIPLGSLMNRIKEKNYDNSGINTVYSVTKENGIVKSDDYSVEALQLLTVQDIEYVVDTSRKEEKKTIGFGIKE